MIDVSGLPIDLLGKLYRSSIALPEQDTAAGIDSQAVDSEEAGQGADGLCERSARH